MRKLVMFLMLVCAIFGFTYGVTEVFFAPDDRPARRLVELIDGAHQKIYAAIYMITDQHIAQALIRARKRGVAVQIIVDTSSMIGSYAKGQQLKAGNIDLYVFGGAQQSFRQPLMHNKFAIIDNKVWTGSFNWTKSANEKNQENVILTDSAEVLVQFERHFQRLKGRCRHYASSPQLPSKEEQPTSWWQELWTSSVTKVGSFFSYIKDDIRKTVSHI